MSFETNIAQVFSCIFVSHTGEHLKSLMKLRNKTKAHLGVELKSEIILELNNGVTTEVVAMATTFWLQKQQLGVIAFFLDKAHTSATFKRMGPLLKVRDRGR